MWQCFVLLCAKKIILHKLSFYVRHFSRRRYLFYLLQKSRRHFLLGLYTSLIVLIGEFMTVKEMIIHLLSFPMDKEVVVLGHDFSFDLEASYKSLSADSFSLAKIEIDSSRLFCLRENSSFCEKLVIG